MGVAGFLWWKYAAKVAPRPIETARRHAPAPKKAVPKVVVPAKPALPPVVAAVRPSRLAKIPDVFKGIYFTGWSAGLRSRVDYLVSLSKTTGLNTVVFDIKDYSGYVAYPVDVPEVKQYGSVRVMVRDIDGLINRLHQEGIYVVARITVFQDPILAAARPELAVHRKSLLGDALKPELKRSTLWLDRKGLAWIDPASRAAWDYIESIATDAAGHGFDELNFDYVRFPSDGDLKDMYYPAWDGKTPKHMVLRAFFADLRKKLPSVPISADLFGLATVNSDDLGIGQIIEDGYTGFDYVCPMVYPSHYARKFLGFPNPAEHPYEVVNYSMQHAVERLEALTPPGKVKLRPWLQDFNLGARYDAEMVKSQIKAVRDALGDRYAGFLLWSPSNRYTSEALN